MLKAYYKVTPPSGVPGLCVCDSIEEAEEFVSLLGLSRELIIKATDEEAAEYERENEERSKLPPLAPGFKRAYCPDGTYVDAQTLEEACELAKARQQSRRPERLYKVVIPNAASVNGRKADKPVALAYASLAQAIKVADEAEIDRASIVELSREAVDSDPENSQAELNGLLANLFEAGVTEADIDVLLGEQVEKGTIKPGKRPGEFIRTGVKVRDGSVIQ